MQGGARQPQEHKRDGQHQAGRHSRVAVREAVRQEGSGRYACTHLSSLPSRLHTFFLVHSTFLFLFPDLIINN